MPHSLNISKLNYTEDISDIGFQLLIKSNTYEEVTLPDLSKAIEAGGNVLVPQDLEGYTVIDKYGRKQVKFVKKRRASPLKDVSTK